MIISVSFLVDEQNGITPACGSSSRRPIRTRPSAAISTRWSMRPAARILPALADRVLSAMQRTYYTVKGSQSQVTLETARQAQQIFAGEVARSMLAPPWGAVVLSILPDRLAIAGVGTAFALITGDDGTVHVMPPDRLADGASEGDQEPALWPLHRQKVVGADDHPGGQRPLAGGSPGADVWPPPPRMSIWQTATKRRKACRKLPAAPTCQG